MLSMSKLQRHLVLFGPLKSCTSKGSDATEVPHLPKHSLAKNFAHSLLSRK